MLRIVWTMHCLILACYAWAEGELVQAWDKEGGSGA